MGTRTVIEIMINKNDYTHINLDCIYEMADGEDDFVIEIIDSCLDAIGPGINELKDAINANDVTTILFLSHKLKGSLRFIGINHLGDILEQIELFYQSGATGSATDLITEVEKYYADAEKELKHAVNALRPQ